MAGQRYFSDSGIDIRGGSQQMKPGLPANNQLTSRRPNANPVANVAGATKPVMADQSGIQQAAQHAQQNNPVAASSVPQQQPSHPQQMLPAPSMQRPILPQTGRTVLAADEALTNSLLLALQDIRSTLHCPVVPTVVIKSAASPYQLRYRAPVRTVIDSALVVRDAGLPDGVRSVKAAEAERGMYPAVLAGNDAVMQSKSAVDAPGMSDRGGTAVMAKVAGMAKAAGMVVAAKTAKTANLTVRQLLEKHAKSPFCRSPTVEKIASIGLSGSPPAQPPMGPGMQPATAQPTPEMAMMSQLPSANMPPPGMAPSAPGTPPTPGMAPTPPGVQPPTGMMPGGAGGMGMAPAPMTPGQQPPPSPPGTQKTAPVVSSLLADKKRAEKEEDYSKSDTRETLNSSGMAMGIQEQQQRRMPRSVGARVPIKKASLITGYERLPFDGSMIKEGGRRMAEIALNLLSLLNAGQDTYASIRGQAPIVDPPSQSLPITSRSLTGSVGPRPPLPGPPKLPPGPLPTPPVQVPGVGQILGDVAKGVAKGKLKRAACFLAPPSTQPVSATGDSRGIDFQTLPDHHATGAAAWDIKRYSRSRSQAHNEKDRRVELAKNATDLTPFARGFLSRCANPSTQLIHRIETDFGKQAADEIRDGLIKLANTKLLNKVVGEGAKQPGWLSKAVDWGRGFFGYTPRGGAIPRSSAPAPLFEPVKPVVQPPRPVQAAQLPQRPQLGAPAPVQAPPRFAQPIKPPQSDPVSPWWQSGYTASHRLQNLGEQAMAHGMPMAGGAVGGYFAGDDLGVGSTSGALAGAAIFNPALRRYLARNAGGYGSHGLLPINAFKGSMVGSLAGSAVDSTLGAFGLNQDEAGNTRNTFGRIGAYGGLGLGATAGAYPFLRRAAGRAIPGSNASTLLNTARLVSHNAGKAQGAVDGFGLGAMKPLWSVATYPFVKGYDYISRGARLADKAKRLGLLTGSVGLGVSGIGGAYRAAKSTIGGHVDDKVEQIKGQVGQDMRHAMGMQPGGSVHQLMSMADSLIQSMGLNPQEMSPVQKVMLLGGGAAGIGGMATGNPLLAMGGFGLGALGGFGGTMPQQQPGMPTYGSPYTPGMPIMGGFSPNQVPVNMPAARNEFAFQANRQQPTGQGYL